MALRRRCQTMPSLFLMRFTSFACTVVPHFVEGLHDTMGEVTVYSAQAAGFMLYIDPHYAGAAIWPNETEAMTMQNLRWTDEGKRSAAVCERDFTIERR